MPPPIQIPEDTGISYLIILAFVVLGTLARLFYNWMAGNPVSFIFAIGQMVISTFAASIMIMIAIRLGWGVHGISISAGMAAWLGVKIIDFFEKWLLNRLSGRH